MNELIFALLTWIGNHTDYEVKLNLPNIVLTEKYNMCTQYGISQKTNCDASGLMGFYNKKVTIYLHDDFNFHESIDASRLVHELVHYVQWKNGEQKRRCLGHLELEAYELQDLWRAQQGLEPVADDFKKIMLAASCDT